MANENHKLLFVEDDLDVAEMLSAYFRVQGYDVITANWGEDGINKAVDSMPDLIILDINLPDMQGFDVAIKLRETSRTANIPIIFLTDQREKDQRLKGLSLGADDYITKPFDIQELRLRVRNALRRVSSGTTNNPVTNLPESNLIDEYLTELIKNPGSRGTALVRIENLEKFREAYGFIASDDVLRAIALMIQSILHDKGSPSDIIGHISTADFVLAAEADRLSDIVDQTQTRLPQSIELFYPMSAKNDKNHEKNRLSIKVGSIDKETLGTISSLEDLKDKLVKSLG